MSVSGRAGTTALATHNPASLKEQIREKVQRAINEAREKASYDASGRMMTASIQLPGLGKFNFTFTYDRKNRLQYIIDENGARTRYEYGKNDELKSITLPDGTPMYELDENGKGVFFKHGFSRKGGALRFSKSAMVQDGDVCKAAVAAAAIASVQAAAACGSGDVPACIMNTAVAAASAYAAYVACKDRVIGIEEGPVV